jgi:SAM-dependent methyltransferase
VVPLFDCSSCGFIFAPDAVSDEQRHRTDYHAARTDAIDPTLYSVDILHMLWSWAQKLGWTPETSILDVGCAEGRLLEIARCMGLRAEGIDISNRYAAVWQTHGLQAAAASATEYSRTHSKTFDVIIARQVIEHVANPRDFLQACAAMLRPGGHCLVETADPHSFQVRLQGHRWSYWVPAEGIGKHVSFLGRHSAEVLGSRVGLVLRDSVPTFRYIPFASYARQDRRRRRGPFTLLKYFFHCSRLSGGRCLWFSKSGDGR